KCPHSLGLCLGMGVYGGGTFVGFPDVLSCPSVPSLVLPAVLLFPLSSFLPTMIVRILSSCIFLSIVCCYAETTPLANALWNEKNVLFGLCCSPMSMGLCALFLWPDSALD
ncbi:hypothetical protein DNTS_034803, partial [Danionella cerebrum]